MIGLSTRLFNLAGFWVLHPKPRAQDYRKLERRVSRTATLDGGASVVDLGYSDADRTFRFDFDGIEADTVEQIATAVKLYSEFVLCSDEGAFFVTPQLFDYRGGVLTLVLLVSGAA